MRLQEPQSAAFVLGRATGPDCCTRDSGERAILRAPLGLQATDEHSQDRVLVVIPCRTASASLLSGILPKLRV
jgi:hypothetical protein